METNNRLNIVLIIKVSNQQYILRNQSNDKLQPKGIRNFANVIIQRQAMLL